MLSIKNIDTYYGEVQALMDVSVEIGEKEIVAIIEMCIRDSSTRLSTYAFASIVLYLPLFLVCCSCAERNTDMPSCIFCPVQGNCVNIAAMVLPTPARRAEWTLRKASR